MSGNDTMEVSSTMTTSSTRGWPAWWRMRTVPGRAPSRACTVVARAPSSSSASPSTSGSVDCRSWAATAWKASPMRAAALPVGAARAMRRRPDGSPARSRASRAATVWVLPVPGPPTMTDSRRDAPAVAADHWGLSAAGSPGRERDEGLEQLGPSGVG